MTTYTLLDTVSTVKQLQAGHIIAYPTEAVFGLGCDPANESAVRELLSLKDRHESAGLVLIASDYAQLEPWISDVDESHKSEAMQSWPGPVTWLFPRAAHVPDFVAGRHDTIAVRITAHKSSRELCKAFGSALISTSANPSTATPARSAQEVHDYFGHHIKGILAGSLGKSEKPSEIRDLVSGTIIRQG